MSTPEQAGAVPAGSVQVNTLPLAPHVYAPASVTAPNIKPTPSVSVSVVTDVVCDWLTVAVSV